MLRHETALIICSVALVASISGGSQAFAAQEDAPKADIVMRSGNVLTIDAEDRIAQAIAIRGHRIVAVGTDEQLNRFIGSDTEVLELGGRTVAPGFIDAHNHVF